MIPSGRPLAMGLPAEAPRPEPDLEPADLVSPDPDPDPAPGPAEPEPPSAVGRLASGASWSTLNQLAPLVLNLALTPYVIRHLGLQRWGLYFLALSITSFLSSFDGGIAATAQRYLAVHAGADDREASTRLVCTLTLVILGAGSVLWGVSVAVAPLLESAFSVPRSLHAEALVLFRALGLLVIGALLSQVWNAVLQARGRFAFLAKWGLVTSLVWTAGLFLVVRMHWGLRGIALLFVSQQFLAVAGAVPPACRYLSRRGIGLVPRAEISEFFRYGFKVQMFGFSRLVNMQFDGLLIGAVLPLATVGVYGSGANFAMQLRSVPANGLSPVQAYIGNKLGSHGSLAAMRTTVRLQRVWVVGVTGFCAASIGAVYFVLTAWLGPHFRLAGEVALVLLIGHTVSLYAGVLTSYAAVARRPEIELRYGIMGMVVNVALTVPLVFGGAVGVVAATSAGEIIAALYLLRVIHQRLDGRIPSFLREIPIVPALVCLGITAGLELLAAPLVPEGPGGMVLCALPAAAGLGVYAAIVLGPRRLMLLLRTRRLGDALRGTALLAAEPDGMPAGRHRARPTAEITADDRFGHPVRAS